MPACAEAYRGRRFSSTRQRHRVIHTISAPLRERAARAASRVSRHPRVHEPRRRERRHPDLRALRSHPPRTAGRTPPAPTRTGPECSSKGTPSAPACTTQRAPACATAARHAPAPQSLHLARARIARVSTRRDRVEVACASTHTSLSKGRAAVALRAPHRRRQRHAPCSAPRPSAPAQPRGTRACMPPCARTVSTSQRGRAWRAQNLKPSPDPALQATCA